MAILTIMLVIITSMIWMKFWILRAVMLKRSKMTRRASWMCLKVKTRYSLQPIRKLSQKDNSLSHRMQSFRKNLNRVKHHLMNKLKKNIKGQRQSKRWEDGRKNLPNLDKDHILHHDFIILNFDWILKLYSILIINSISMLG